MRYRALLVLSILSVLAVSAVGASADAGQTSLADEMDRASREYGVPRELLLAMGYVNTRWEMPRHRPAISRAVTRKDGATTGSWPW